MARRQRSPVVVGQCFDWPFPPRAADDPRRVCRWVCARDPAGAEFVNRRSRQTAVLHPSTKRKGVWQVSFFDQHGAISDIAHRDCSTALYNAGITPAIWKLRAVQPIGKR